MGHVLWNRRPRGVAVRRAAPVAVAPVAGVGLAVEDKRACDMISMPAQSGPTSNLRDGVATGQNGVRGPSIRHGHTTRKGFAPVQALSLAWM